MGRSISFGAESTPELGRLLAPVFGQWEVLPALPPMLRVADALCMSNDSEVQQVATLRDLFDVISL